MEYVLHFVGSACLGMLFFPILAPNTERWVIGLITAIGYTSLVYAWNM